MPKATKRKREKQADFKKAKLKLGKGKQAPSNATDTSFKARSIALPNQQQLERALQDTSASGQPTSSSGFTLDEVLVRLRHPNAGVRKETLGGVKDVLLQGPEKQVSKVLRALGALITDDDGTVRRAFFKLLEWYFPLLPLSALSPHLDFFLVQLSSGLSSIFPEIRLDSCRLVQLVLASAPEQVTAGWPASSKDDGESGRRGNTILEGIRLAIGLFGEKGGASGQMGRLGSGARLVVLHTMLAFVRAALGDEPREGEAGPSRGTGQPHATLSRWLVGGLPSRGGKGKGKEVQVDLDGLVGEARMHGALVPAYAAGATTSEGSAWDLRQALKGEDLAGLLQTGVAGDQRATGVAMDPVQHLYIQLAPLLVSTFLEAAPTAFSPSASSSNPTSAEETATSLCLACASLTEVLLQHIIEGSPLDTASVRDPAVDFARRMSPYFPFRGPRAATTASGVSPAFALSMSYANLVTLLSGQPPAVKMTGRKGWRGRVQAIQEAWGVAQDQQKAMKRGKKGKAPGLEDVSEWIIDVLRPKQDALAPPVTAEAYAAVLPIVWSIITHPTAAGTDSAAHDELGVTFFQHLLRQGSSSAIRSIGDAFVILLILVHEQPSPSYPFYLPPSAALRPLVREWLVGVPRVLWELGAKRIDATERLAQFLLEIGRRGASSFERPHSLIDQEALSEIATELTAYFSFHHPKLGERSGPWHHLPDKKLQKFVLDMSRWWTEYDASGTLDAAIQKAAVGIPASARA